MKYPKEHKIIKPNDYTLAVDTDISKTFKRIRAEQAKVEKAKDSIDTETNVRLLKNQKVKK